MAFCTFLTFHIIKQPVFLICRVREGTGTAGQLFIRKKIAYKTIYMCIYIYTSVYIIYKTVYIIYKTCHIQ